MIIDCGLTVLFSLFLLLYEPPPRLRLPRHHHFPLPHPNLNTSNIQYTVHLKIPTSTVTPQPQPRPCLQSRPSPVHDHYTIHHTPSRPSPSPAHDYSYPPRLRLPRHHHFPPQPQYLNTSTRHAMTRHRHMPYTSKRRRRHPNPVLVPNPVRQHLRHMTIHLPRPSPSHDYSPYTIHLKSQTQTLNPDANTPIRIRLNSSIRNSQFVHPLFSFAFYFLAKHDTYPSSLSFLIRTNQRTTTHMSILIPIPFR
ncbi:hypothetical protein D9758_011012 [Tetrapyrgos nigripes]|uniref:Uncharacterized protein n=1 Tax=Tetrapyrgos nigripes TaxID=182062 RepID=A0A8H5GHY2_9AGAR|nr:hypothetical protein D9758_011012 [Tetrapyrgos nigripes]